MFWIIGTNDEPVMNESNTADRDRLRDNPAMAGQLARVLYQYRLADVQAALAAPAVGANEPLYIIAHAGGHPQPWIAGVYLQDFVDAMVTKYTAAGLSNRVIWMLVCHVGTEIQAIAARLAHHHVVSTSIYVPTDFMYISSTGIPHIMLYIDDPDRANEVVASNDSDFVTIPNSQNTGVGWAGRTISALGVVATIAPGTVKDDVVARFDPDETEVN
jgi:hypothetical protein